MKVLERICGYIEKIIDITGCAALVFVTLITFINVCFRYLLAHPLVWADELATSGFVWIIFIGAAARFRAEGHICIEFFYDIVPDRAKKLLEFVSNLILLITSGYFTKLAFIFAVSAVDKKTPMLKISYLYIDIAAAIGFGAITIFAFLKVLQMLIKDKADGNKQEG